jgi:hypothetical protein
MLAGHTPVGAQPPIAGLGRNAPGPLSVCWSQPEYPQLLPDVIAVKPWTEPPGWAGRL